MEKKQENTIAMTEKNETGAENNKPAFEQELVSKVAQEFLKEQRRGRRWGIFFKLLFAVYLLGFFAIYFSKSNGESCLEKPIASFTSSSVISGLSPTKIESFSISISTILRVSPE